MHTLELLRLLGLDPQSTQARRATELVRDHVTWEGGYPTDEWAGNAFFAGEVEPCINGVVVAIGAYFGQDVRALADRLLGEQLADGGWNCEAENGATVSSFGTTIRVLEGLLEFERTMRDPAEVRAARLRGQEYLLERRLFRRKSTGEVIDDDWLRFAFPTWHYYDVLRGLDYLRAAAAEPDPRIREAIDVVERNRAADGRWPLQRVHEGEAHLDMDEGEGKPSRWNTLRALRVLDWAGGGGGAVRSPAEPPRRSRHDRADRRPRVPPAGRASRTGASSATARAPTSRPDRSRRAPGWCRRSASCPGSGPTSPTSTCGTTA